MDIRTIGQPIAERRYVLSGAPGSPDEEVIVRIGLPQESPDHYYFCPFEIVGFGTTRIRYAAGGDAFQALQLALGMIGTSLHYHRQRLGSEFYFLEAGDDLGFPEKAWTEGLGHQIVKAFGPVYGLKLSIARNAASMKNFQFGTITPDPSGTGTIGQYALHIQCPWRIVVSQCSPWRLPTRNLMVTGSDDWWEPAEVSDTFDWGDWNKNRSTPSLQQKLLEELFQEYDSNTKSWVNVSEQLVVEQVEADDYGGFDIHLSGGYRLQVFPSGKSGEHWRLFQPGDDSPHFSSCGMGPS